MGINYYSKKIIQLLGISLFSAFALFEIGTINKQFKAEKNLAAATEKDLFLYRQMGASYLCIASKAEVDFNKGLGIASATFANVIIGKDKRHPFVGIRKDLFLLQQQDFFRL